MTWKMEGKLSSISLLFICMLSFTNVHGSVQSANGHWMVTEWSECSASCNGVRVRSVQCVDRYGLASERCHSQKPKTHHLCNQQKCNPAAIGFYPRHYLQQRVIDGEEISTSEHTVSNVPVTDELQSVRQTEMVEWTVSAWSECSVTCGGGFRVRSVRCLDECGIISPQFQRCSTSKDSRPSTYEFCAQTNCITGIIDDDILPINGSSISEIPDGSHSVLEFASSGVRRYQVDHSIMETDGTITLLMTTVSSRITTFICQVHPAEIIITRGQSMGQSVINLNGEFLFLFDSIETEIVLIGEMVAYENSTVTILRSNTEIQFPNISIFWYCDSFRCYKFNSSKSSFVRSGPTGKLFTSNNVALYSIASQVNSRIEDLLIISFVPTTTITPSPTTLMPSGTFSSITIVASPTVVSSTFISSFFTFTISPSITAQSSSIVGVSFTSETVTTPAITATLTTGTVVPTTLFVSTFTQTQAPSATPTATPGPQGDKKPIILCEKTKSAAKSQRSFKSRSSKTDSTVETSRDISVSTLTRKRGTKRTTKNSPTRNAKNSITKRKSYYIKHTGISDDQEMSSNEISTRTSSSTADAATDITKSFIHAYATKSVRVTHSAGRPLRPITHGCRKKTHNHVAKPEKLKSRKRVRDPAATRHGASSTHGNSVTDLQRKTHGSRSDKTPKPTVQNKLGALFKRESII